MVVVAPRLVLGNASVSELCACVYVLVCVRMRARECICLCTRAYLQVRVVYVHCI